MLLSPEIVDNYLQSQKSSRDESEIQQKVYNRQDLIEKMNKHNRMKVENAMELVKNISDLFIGG